MLASSSARLLTILDGIFHVIAYIVYVHHSGSYVSFFSFLAEDFRHFHFSRSVLDIVLIALVRAVVLFLAFAYKRQLSQGSLFVAFTVGLSSAVYSVVKVLAASATTVRAVAIFSLAIAIAEQLLFALVRRRRVEDPGVFEEAAPQPDQDLASIHCLAPAHARPASPLPAAAMTAPLPVAKRAAQRPGRAAGRRIGVPPMARSFTPTPVELAVPEQHPIRAEQPDYLSADLGTHSTLSSAAIGDTLVTLQQPSQLLLAQVPGLAPCTAVPADVLRLASPDSIFVTFEGVLIHYRYSVPPAHKAYFQATDAQARAALPTPPPALMMMHGFGSGAFSFEQLTARVGDACAACLSFDRPGFGLSARLNEAQVLARERAQTLAQRDRQRLEQERQRASERLGQGVLANVYSEDRALSNEYPDVNPYRCDFSVRLAYALTRRHGLDATGVVLLGHHSGAGVACRAAVADARLRDVLAAAGQVRRPVVRGLVLIAPSLHEDGFPPLVRSLFATSLGRSMVEQLLRSEVSEVALRRAWADPRRIPARVFALHRAMAQLPGWTEAYTCMASQPRETAEIVGHLAQVRCPVLLAHGDLDKIIPPASSQRTAKEFTEAASVQLLRMPQCGHVPHEEQPGVLAQALVAFLALAGKQRS